MPKLPPPLTDKDGRPIKVTSGEQRVAWHKPIKQRARLFQFYQVVWCTLHWRGTCFAPNHIGLDP